MSDDTSLKDIISKATFVQSLSRWDAAELFIGISFYYFDQGDESFIKLKFFKTLSIQTIQLVNPDRGRRG